MNKTPEVEATRFKAAALSSEASSLAKSCASLARLRKHADYQRVYHATRKQFSASMSWFVAVRPDTGKVSAAGVAGSAAGCVVPVSSVPRVGLTVGKVIGKAHERNRIKRRMREAVRQHLLELPDDVDLILHPKRSVMTMDFVKLEAEILRIFRQASGQIRSQRKDRVLSINERVGNKG